MRDRLRDHALSLTMFGGFVLFVLLQSIFGWQTRNEELAQYGVAVDSYWAYLGSGHLMQNWQSEFLAVGALAVLSIFLRQHGSPESKPVTKEAAETGS